ncbi:MAG: hypothetical protein K9J37_07610 [Saprospiraceae bacterium]|nr:hypothetical protein [Saprospiraceae bacterium]MCF8249763.1 hypothetical protein [Saprospiraceae bacterium]MCF8279248.1 hypothetical protein [Bacteroidales bacterium]MCF8312796.1 hypothetical protein [Saprospiraceae bacterium]MCF8441243.1 hypothetical protein [Saprospiraceae bacterium]
MPASTKAVAGIFLVPDLALHLAFFFNGLPLTICTETFFLDSSPVGTWSFCPEITIQV